jgi:hypothetical protein
VLIAASAASSIVTTTLGLMKSDVSVQGRAVTLDDTALKAVLAGQLKASGLKPVIEGLMLLKDSEVMAKLTALWDQYAELKEAAARRRAELDPRKEELASIDAHIVAVQAEYDEARKGGDSAATSRLAAQLDELRQERRDKDYTSAERAALISLEAADWLLTSFDAFAAAVSTVPSGATRSPLQAAALREVVHGRKQGEHLLFATISASGGDAIQKQPNAVGFGAHTKFVAGVVVTYMLIESDGEIVAADLTSHYGEKEFHF